ncbi:FAD-dependent monooxygenase [uncultured Dokdonia sp.]|uniref:NAD(P)/FAD-dependent oxidoreductase n=1 Tax=uncultured Dokdonia sp. TaxID=575653 RepID=UPI0026217CC1|nr:FAD-dependent monooxygenase [uncultured Dokdonia sp.]
MIKTDVIIIGSGISGLTLSLLLERKQIPHIVLHRVQKQKVMALGETLPPSAMALLEELELLSFFQENALRKTYGYHAVWGSKALQTTNFFTSNPFKYGLKIDKQGIQTALKAKVASHILPFDLLDTINHTKSKVTVTITHKKEKQHIEGNYIVDATGRNRVLLQSLQIPIKQYDELLAFSCHLPKKKHKHMIHEVVTESFAGGWGIVSGLDKETQVMTLYTTKNTGLHKQLTAYSHWKTILSGTKYLRKYLAKEVPNTIHGGKADSSAPQQIAGENWIAIGDAAIAFDPLSSHGITNAIYTAHRACEAFTSPSYSLQEYHQDMQAILTTYLDTKNTLYLREQRWPENEFWETYHSNDAIALIL